MIKIGPDGAGRVRVTFPYNPDLVAKLKTIKTHWWHSDGKYWSFDRSKAILEGIIAALAGEELDIDP